MTWRERARALELRQRTIAALLGHSEQWVSRHMEDRIAVRLAVLDWEIRGPADRAALLIELDLVPQCWHQKFAPAERGVKAKADRQILMSVLNTEHTREKLKTDP